MLGLPRCWRLLNREVGLGKPRTNKTSKPNQFYLTHLHKNVNARVCSMEAYGSSLLARRTMARALSAATFAKDLGLLRLPLRASCEVSWLDITRKHLMWIPLCNIQENSRVHSYMTGLDECITQNPWLELWHPWHSCTHVVLNHPIVFRGSTRRL
jgi:hypothetical protein